MFRFDIINKLIEKHGYESYLEIGTQGDACLREIKCNYKVGIDPDPVFHDEKNSNEFHTMNSDLFFSQNVRRFDLVFVDGLHESPQVKKDIRNSLHYLKPGGTVVVHDCNPQEEINQQVPMPHVGSWNGDVWRAWLWFRQLATADMYVIDADEGCGVIQRGYQQTINYDSDMTFAEFAENRKKLLNLISLDEWEQRYINV